MNSILRLQVANTLQRVGANGFSLSVVDVLTDLFEGYISQICKHCLMVAENHGRTDLSLSDVTATFRLFNICPFSLGDLIQQCVGKQLKAKPEYIQEDFITGFPLLIKSDLQESKVVPDVELIWPEYQPQVPQSSLPSLPETKEVVHKPKNYKIKKHKKNYLEQALTADCQQQELDTYSTEQDSLCLFEQNEILPSLLIKKTKKNDEIRCICDMPRVDDGGLMICCDSCSTWFHARCVGTQKDAWFCLRCN